MAASASDCWGAFGSDTDTDDDSAEGSGTDERTFEPVADATSLAITQHFASLSKSTGVSLQERVVGIGFGGRSDGRDELRETMMGRVGGRGMKIAEAESDESEGGSFLCDAAILLNDNITEKEPDLQISCLRRALLPGGFLWLITSLREGGCGVNTSDVSIPKQLGEYSEAIWDIDSALVIFSSPDFQVISVQKRSCTINAKSCPWMDKEQKITRGLFSAMREDDKSHISESGSFLQYERKMASAITISPSVAERTRENIEGSSTRATILTDANVERAKSILQTHGFLVIKGLLPPAQTVPWGAAVLSDFESAVARLKCHPTRPVDLMNPRATASGGENATPSEDPVFEPLSYKEMAMREDLRVDLRSGPEMTTLRHAQNDLAFRSMDPESRENINTHTGADLHNGPTVIHSDCMGTVRSWRFHPTILAIIKALFNPQDDSLSKGNFGRWNFGGAGPDGSPQPFRLGQIGSVLSCPGSGDQAIHADTAHLFEHVDCLPCHYLNVFTPGYNLVHDSDNDCFQNEFDNDGNWTGNSTLGGTAFVHGSHKLSVTTQLLSEDDEGTMDTDENDNGNPAALRRRLLQLRTLRPALDAGDVVFFDCRTIHYGLANTSRGDRSGKNVNAGRRPMLYLNVSQSWFHDPKNWDDRERIFDEL